MTPHEVLFADHGCGLRTSGYYQLVWDDLDAAPEPSIRPALAAFEDDDLGFQGSPDSGSPTWDAAAHPSRFPRSLSLPHSVYKLRVQSVYSRVSNCVILASAVLVTSVAGSQLGFVVFLEQPSIYALL